jgi:hypothetical protein
LSTNSLYVSATGEAAYSSPQTFEPLDFDHQSNMDDWLILDKIEDVVVGTSIKYNYDKARF